MDNKEIEKVTDELSKEGFSVNADEAVEEKKKDTLKDASKELFEWLEVIVTAVISVVVIFTLVFRVATIDGPSMKETLHHGDKVIISNFAYTPKRGDIVVVSRNEDNSLDGVVSSEMPIIKRVIATAGQTVDINFETGEVFVNGKLLDEPYISTPTKRSFDVEFPLTVAPGCIFVLGDNRMDSMDSRDSRIGNDGMIDVRYVLGKAIYRIYPFDAIGGLYNE